MSFWPSEEIEGGGFGQVRRWRGVIQVKVIVVLPKVLRWGLKLGRPPAGTSVYATSFKRWFLLILYVICVVLCDFVVIFFYAHQRN